MIENRSARIQRAGESDIPLLHALINSAYRGDHSRKGWTTEADLLDGTRLDEMALLGILRDPSSVMFKYMQEMKPVGCVQLRKEGTRLYLGLLTVSPDLQGRGIGKELLFAAEDEAIRSGCASIFMTVISARTELVAWYLRHGYSDTGIRKPFDNEDPRFGIPKTSLDFAVLEKHVAKQPDQTPSG